MGMFSLVSNILLVLMVIVVVVNFSFGMVVCLSGVIWDFFMMKE